MMNELLTLQEMPEQANATHFRAIRDFISRFVRLCGEKRIGTAHLEPILIASVVASFNQQTFSNWKAQMVSAKTSLRAIREFLANQEESLGDRWFVTSRFTLARATKAAQEMVAQTKLHQENPPSNFSLPSENVNQNVKRSYADSVKESTTPSCSHWSPRDQRSANHSPLGARGGQRSHPGSQEKNLANKPKVTNKKENHANNEKGKKKYKCISCGGSHQLFFCPIYLGATLEDRWSYVKSKRLCQLCLSEKHSLLLCTNGICKNCDGNGDAIHNSTLCKISYQNKQKGQKKDDEDWDEK